MIFPEDFIASIKTAESFDEKAFIQIHSEPPPVSVRVNRKKNIQSFQSHLHIPWCETGYYLPERPKFTLDPLLHAGCYYVQEASSMFLEYVLKQVVDFHTSIKVLDLCAAPGGKSTLISSLLNQKSFLVSNEVIRSRVNVLKENVTKWGDANVIITNNDAVDFHKLENYFDVIVVDAPCSGSGLFRKDAKALEEWSEENVIHCSRRQQRILEDVIPALKQDGILIYSTCSYSVEENENIINEILQLGFETKNPEVPEVWGVVKNESGFRFYPNKVKGEGFFISVLKRVKKQVNVNDDENYDLSNANIEKLTDDEIQVVKQWIDENTKVDFFKKGPMLFASPQNMFSDLEFLSSALKVIKAGVYCGEVKGKNFIPSHELALSTIIHPDLQEIAVDEESALNYLRKKEIETDSKIKGWALVKYKEHNLGWIKVLENRINNYYPMEWRIKSL
ncbi:MAG: RsmF rRNA methyltransferase first C-terminal domain-containing protein [Chitinophagales bacterium]